jgi:hypothetical protein
MLNIMQRMTGDSKLIGQILDARRVHPTSTSASLEARAGLSGWGAA